MRLISGAMALVIMVAWSVPATATNSEPELEWVMARLLDWLPGEYTTAPQLETEREFGPPPDTASFDTPPPSVPDETGNYPLPMPGVTKFA